MQFEKPIIFFSHSSRDKTALKLLKGRFVELTGGTIDVFLSSDGQSIRLGSNWVASVEAALNAAKIMFVFVSPDSLHSPWLYFEAGHAYSKKIAVIPVGVFGVDIGQLPPPMNLLQGFNLVDDESLNNLIVTVNETFGFSHACRFNRNDAAAFDSAGQSLSLSLLLGNHGASVEHLVFTAACSAEMWEKLLDSVRTLHGYFEVGKAAVVPGIQLSFGTDNKADGVAAEVVPYASAIAVRALEGGLGSISRQSGDSPCPYACKIKFTTDVTFELEPHRQLARLGTRVSLEEGGSQDLYSVRYRWNSITFNLASSLSFNGERRHVFLCAKTSSPTFEQSAVGDLVNLLFECGVLGYR